MVGGGQAGLAISYHLKAAGIRHLVLEGEQVAHAWRNQRWDSFCLVTPNWQCRLPGFPYRGDDPDGFMEKQEIIEYVEGFAASFEPPLHEGVAVEKITPLEVQGYRVALRRSDTAEAHLQEVSADQVVVAVSGYQRPRIPDFARELPEPILQVHSSSYRNSQQFPDGGVLVVGSGQSGCQIAEDLHYAGRSVYLSLGNAPRSPRRYRGRDVVAWLEEMGHYDKPITEFDHPDEVRRKTNHYVTGRDGGKEIDLRVHASAGMQLLGRLERMNGAGVASFLDDVASRLDQADATYRRICASIDTHIAERGLDAPTEPAYEPPWHPCETPGQLNLLKAGIVAVVWAIGFDTSFQMIDADVFDEAGHPRHMRGVTDQDGLYFLGLPWLHSWGSGRFSHVDRDARHLASIIVPRARARSLSS